MTVNDELILWNTTSERKLCVLNTNFRVTNETDLEISTHKGVVVAVAKKMKVTRSGKVFEYLNMFVKNKEYLMSQATGLIGEHLLPYHHKYLNSVDFLLIKTL